MPSEKNADCTLIDRFSLRERIVMQSCLLGITAIGTYGIYQASPLWSALYVAYCLMAFALIVLPAMCAHCPYPYQHDSCLFLPPALLKRFYPYRGPRMNPMGKFGAFAAMAGMVLIPNIWLIGDQMLLLLFWLVALPTVAAFPQHYCKRCRHFSCPMNRAKAKASCNEDVIQL